MVHALRRQQANEAQISKGRLSIHQAQYFTRWWFQRFFVFLPLPAKMIQFEEHIFQMGYSTTNQISRLMLFWAGKIPKKVVKSKGILHFTWNSLGWNHWGFAAWWYVGPGSSCVHQATQRRREPLRTGGDFPMGPSPMEFHGGERQREENHGNPGWVIANPYVNGLFEITP